MFLLLLNNFNGALKIEGRVKKIVILSNCSNQEVLIDFMHFSFGETDP
jgi:hypothetical protein